MSEDFDDLDDGITYCVYCYDEVPDWKGSCCGENHFSTGFELKKHFQECDEIDRQMVRASGKVYDPPMSDTEQYLLNKEREEEHKSYDY
jgi:hypothetical protein